VAVVYEEDAEDPITSDRRLDGWLHHARQGWHHTEVFTVYSADARHPVLSVLLPGGGSEVCRRRASPSRSGRMWELLTSEEHDGIITEVD